MTTRTFLAALALGCCASASVQAASIYLTPAMQDLAAGVSPASMDLMMDFAASELTLGGGIDVDVSGIATFRDFIPSAYFTTVADPAFSGHGTLRADNDYEIHFGSFNGLSGLNKLGTIRLNMQAPILGTTAMITLTTNSFFGGFVSASPTPLNVTMTGAVVSVPEPAAAALLLAGLGIVGIAVARRARRS